MANEIQHAHDATGATLYAVIRRAADGFTWNTAGTPGFEEQNTASWDLGEYVIDDLTETAGGTYFYTGDLPATAFGAIYIHIYNKAGADYAESDPLVGVIPEFKWDSSAVSPPQDANVTHVNGVAVSLATEFEADLTKIKGTALTETAGQLAASFVKMYDVASPTGTVNSLPDAVPGAAGGVFIAGTNASLTVDGATTLTGAVSLGSTLGVTGATTLASLVVSGTTALTGAVTMPAGLTADITGTLSRVTLVDTTTVNTDVATLFTGITVVAEWLGLLAGKQAANATALAEIKATGAGSGTYSETTDSQEAIAEIAGVAAWDAPLANHDTEDTFGNAVNDLIQENATSGLYQFTAAAMENGPTIAAAASSSQGAVDEFNLTAHQHAVMGPFVFTAASSQQGDDHVMTCYSVADPSVIVFEIPTGNITVSGSGFTTLTVSQDDTNTATAQTLRYILRNTTDDTVIATGALCIEENPDVSP